MATTKTATKKKATVVAAKNLKPKKETGADILDRSLEWAEELTKKAGIPAGAYAKGPNGINTFILGRNTGVPGNIQIWAGHKDVNFTVYPDKKKRQAVINVRENKRTVDASFTADLSSGWGEWRDCADTVEAVRSRLNSQSALRTHFSVSLPPTQPDNPVTYKLKSVTQLKPTFIRSQYGSPQERVHKYRVVIEATVPATNVSFLVGFDEKSLFIAMLPKHVKTVDNAHKALRPSGVSADAPRHGEWFFVPATKAELIAIDAALDGRPQGLEKSGPLEYSGRWSPSSHKATEVLWLGDTNGQRYNSARQTDMARYARGTVKDSRAGHHSPLTLGDGNTWYRVVRNSEVVPTATVNNPAGSQSRRWD